PSREHLDLCAGSYPIGAWRQSAPGAGAEIAGESRRSHGVGSFPSIACKKARTDPACIPAAHAKRRQTAAALSAAVVGNLCSVSRSLAAAQYFLSVVLSAGSRGPLFGSASRREDTAQPPCAGGCCAIPSQFRVLHLSADEARIEPDSTSRR